MYETPNIWFIFLLCVCKCTCASIYLEVYHGIHVKVKAQLLESFHFIVGVSGTILSSSSLAEGFIHWAILPAPNTCFLKAVFWTLLNIFKLTCLVIQCQRSRNPRKFLVLLAILRNVHKCFKGHYTICLIILFYSVVTHIMIYKLRQHESTSWSCSQKLLCFPSGSSAGLK